MKIVFFTFYYPPDLSAGSFRSIALAKALSSKMEEGDELHVITTHPNRYANLRVVADDLEVNGKITVHRIAVPTHQSEMVSQARSFGVYAVAAYRLCREISPEFLIGTTSRLMTGVLTGVTAFRLRKKYFIDIRDIFSETISDLFSRKNRMLGSATKLIFSKLEKRLLRGAAGVNVVSEGFPCYFNKNGIDVSRWSFFPNGVDPEFVGFKSERGNSPTDNKTILYAGNIGSGQGLETVIPKLAKQLGDKFQFVVVGDGGAAKLLKNGIEKEGINNVEMVLPVSRTELINYYHKADILFLHLNDMPAFRRVLPSKIFEYAALGKPIVAGLSGYSAKFLKEHVPYATLFELGDFNGAYKAIMQASDTTVRSNFVDQFVKKYSRESIMDKMAKHILK
jgi:glycosyltransferase involved in cell wall biosynthesis